ncbi:MAG: hypothetical protein PHI63_04910 [Patescibacteria group bacterium]|nr:hypothetical protein [Patescibacteria group bacterium]
MVFGNVIRLTGSEGERDYVFLGSAPEVNTVFLASIPDIDQSQAVIRRDNRRSVEPPSQATLRNRDSFLFFFVPLTTEQFRGRIAMLHHTDYDESDMSGYKELPSLCDVDLMKIKQEILNAPTNAVNKSLRKIIQDLG